MGPLAAAFALMSATGLAGCTVAPDAASRATEPSAAPTQSVPSEVSPDAAYALAGLEPVDGEVLSALQRPSPYDLESYLLVVRAGTEQAEVFCDQMGGLLNLRSTPISERQLAGWGLDATPPGELGVCQGSLPGNYSVQRDVLVATEDDETTVWVSVYDTPNR